MNNYEGLAPWYDLLLGEWDETVQRYVHLLTNILPLPQTSRAVDVGCGTGIYLAALAQIFDSVVGIDRSASMLRVARRNLASVEREASFVRALWSRLPICDGIDTVVLCMGNSLAHCLDNAALAEVLLEFKRILGNGVIVVDSRSKRELLRDQGLRLRGRGEVDGRSYRVYDSWRFPSDDIYEIDLVVRESRGEYEETVFRTPLRYRVELTAAITSIAPRIGLHVEECLEVSDFGDSFDIVVLSP